MKLGARLKVVRRGALHGFNRRDPSTFINGIFLLMTVVYAFGGAERVDDVARYVLFVALWLLVVYGTMFELLGHVTELEEKLSEPEEALQALRERAMAFPPIGALPLFGFSAFL